MIRNILTAQQYAVLNTIEQGGTKTGKEIKETLNLTQPACSQIMSRMVKAGLVESERSRVVRYGITREGEKALHRTKDFYK